MLSLGFSVSPECVKLLEFFSMKFLTSTPINIVFKVEKKEEGGQTRGKTSRGFREEGR